MYINEQNSHHTTGMNINLDLLYRAHVNFKRLIFSCDTRLLIIVFPKLIIHHSLFSLVTIFSSLNTSLNTSLLLRVCRETALFPKSKPCPTTSLTNQGNVGGAFIQKPYAHNVLTNKTICRRSICFISVYF